MSLLSENISIKIKDVVTMSWNKASVNVAERPYHALAFRICGSASFSNKNKHLCTNAGDVFYMPSNFSYKAVYEDKNEIIVIHFESDFTSDMENFKLNYINTISALFNELYDVWNKKSPGYYYSALSLMCKIIENISRQQIRGLCNEKIETFEKAIKYMEENYLSQEFTIEKMISFSYMSNTYFRKLFVRRFGASPNRFVISKRLQYAEKMLSSGEYSISEVAEKSGFRDVKYFSRMIKREYGFSPTKLYKHIK